MKFYSVKIGKRTKNGGFNELVSFVCKTENDSSQDVSIYWNNQYSGFDVLVDSVKEIKECEIEQSFSYGRKENEEIIAYKKEIKELKQELLKKEITNLKSKIKSSEYPENVISIIAEIKEIEKTLMQLKTNAKNAIVNHLEIINKDKIHWARTDKGFDDNYESFSYEVSIRGKMIIHRENENEESND